MQTRWSFIYFYSLFTTWVSFDERMINYVLILINELVHRHGSPGGSDLNFKVSASITMAILQSKIQINLASLFIRSWGLDRAWFAVRRLNEEADRVIVGVQIENDAIILWNDHDRIAIQDHWMNIVRRRRLGEVAWGGLCPTGSNRSDIDT